VKKNLGEAIGLLGPFDGSLISEAMAQKTLLLTNAHVCTPEAKLRKLQPFPLDPGKVVVTFFEVRGDDGHPFVVEEVKCRWSSPPWELDATLLELSKAPANVEPPPLSPAIDKLAVKDRLNIVGHPLGGPMSISLQDNRLSRPVGEKFLHYRTPTDPGSSDSPVFDHGWNLVGLHHAAMPEANEGIRMDVLLAALRKKFA